MTVYFFIAAGVAVVLAAALVFVLVRTKRTNGTLYFIKDKANGSPMVYVEFNEDPKYYIYNKTVKFKTKVVKNLGDTD